MANEPTKLHGKQIKEGTIDLTNIFGNLGLSSGDTGKTLVYTHTPTPTVSFEKVKFLNIDGVPLGLTIGQALILNPSGNGVVSSPFVRSFNGGGGDITFNSTDQLPEGPTNKYFSGKTTDNLSEGVINKYFNGKNTDQLGEGSTNLYWTNARFDTRFATKNLQDLANIDLTGILDLDLLKYDLGNDQFVPFTLNAVTVPLDPFLDDGSGTPHENVQDAVSAMVARNIIYEYTLLDDGVQNIIGDGMFIIQSLTDPADCVIVTISNTTQYTALTSLIGTSIFNFTNVADNGKINLNNVDVDPGVGVDWKIQLDNQTGSTQSVRVRKLMG